MQRLTVKLEHEKPTSDSCRLDGHCVECLREFLLVAYPAEYTLSNLDLV